MKVFRNKLYCLYSGHEVELVRAADNSFKLISRNNIRPDLTFLASNNAKDVFVKSVNYEALTNSFMVQTWAQYKGHIWHAEGVHDGKIRLWTEQKMNCPGLSMADRHRYEIWVDPDQIEKLWEERTKSSLELSYPDNLPSTQELSTSHL